ncbi:MAG: radical SAM protein [Anaerolineae bacterium]|nr:radical SAM protein [Anaerolineae bacterium]
MNQYDFANILFAGPCNLRCPYCIGQQVNPALNRNNLNEFPLRNLDRFVELIKQHRVTEIVFTGTTTDPQLYRHEARLLQWLREHLPSYPTSYMDKYDSLPGPSPKRGREQMRYSLHTNGQLALRKMDVFNQYDRVCISFPSFKPDTYQKLMGSSRMPDLAEIMRQAVVPVKISCVLTEHNNRELIEFLDRCGAIGIKRVVLRQLYGDNSLWTLPEQLIPCSVYRGNPVYSYHGMEVTFWRFDQTTSTSLNLFSNGAISPHYLLTQAGEKTEDGRW